MNGIRLSLALPGCSTADILDIAAAAEHWNLGCLWVGDPRGRAANSDDSYVTTTLAALAARTQDLRLGAFLTLRGSSSPIHLAEDLGVADQASGGRIEIGLVAPRSDRSRWAADAARLLNAWHEVALPGGETASVVPAPAQPVMPRIVVGGSAGLAGSLLAGRGVFHAARPKASAPVRKSRLVRDRVVLIVDAPFAGSVQSWLASNPQGCVDDLLARARAASAGEVVFVVKRGGRLTEADLKALGTVVIPALRAPGPDRATIVANAWTWLTEKGDIHEAPLM